MTRPAEHALITQLLDALEHSDRDELAFARAIEAAEVL